MELHRDPDESYLHSTRIQKLVFLDPEAPGMPALHQKKLLFSDELVLMILKYLKNDTLLAFSLTCKKVFNIAQPILTDKLQYKRFGHVHVSGHWDSEWGLKFPDQYETCSPAHLMLSIQRTPRIAQYIQTLEIDTDSYTYMIMGPTDEAEGMILCAPAGQKPQLSEEELIDLDIVDLPAITTSQVHNNSAAEHEALLHFLDHTTFLDDEQKQSWAQMFENDSETAFIRACIILCSMLPNVIRVLFSGEKNEFDFKDFLLFTDSLHEHGPLESLLNTSTRLRQRVKQPLYQLAEVNVVSIVGESCWITHSYGQPIDLHDIAKLSLVPTLIRIELECVNYAPPPDQAIFEWPEGKAGLSNLQEIVMIGPKVLAADFQALMLGLPRLHTVSLIEQLQYFRLEWLNYFRTHQAGRVIDDNGDVIDGHGPVTIYYQSWA